MADLVPRPAHEARCGGRAELAAALQASRRDTLSVFAALERALEGLAVPMHETLNPPLWELGHVGWFQEYWIGRNPQRQQGPRADPLAARAAPGRAGADALYDSSSVPHDSRWSLPLPGAGETRADLARQLEASLAILGRSEEDEASLYFFRLALLHEDMHHEAALYMARSLGIDVGDARWDARPLLGVRTEIAFPAASWRLGGADAGFAFDNELEGRVEALPATRIDSEVVRWREWLPFVEAGGYGRAEFWSREGRDWLARERPGAPRYLRREGGAWQERRGGSWVALDLDCAASHLTYYEAQAWCRWAGRRLPSEGEWERAACERPHDFHWGAVWEWTRDAFLPYDGFLPHPYRDYSAPWFGSRQALRGASHLTQPRMHHPRYRNFFPAHRNDIAAGFRTCAPDEDTPP